MGNAYQSHVKRWDVIAGLMETNGWKHLVDVDPKDGRVLSAIVQHITDLTVDIEHEPEDDDVYEQNTATIPRAENKNVNIVFIEGHDTSLVRKAIQDWYPRLNDGGIMAVGNFRHQEGIPVMRAVADLFPLYSVSVMPDNVAVIVKGES